MKLNRDDNDVAFITSGGIFITNGLFGYYYDDLVVDMNHCHKDDKIGLLKKCQMHK